MTGDSISRPDLAAHREALSLPIDVLIGKLVEIIGRKLTAYVGDVHDVRDIDLWMSGGELHSSSEARLRFAYQIARMLADRDDPKVVQAWLIGLNPELDDRAPLRLMRESDLKSVAPEIMGAARAFAVGG
jgi:hypothetical protein